MVSPQGIAICLVAIFASASAASLNDLALRQQDSCTGSAITFNGVSYCCPGAIINNMCCVGASSSGLHFGSGSPACPDGAPGIPLTASDYSSLVAAATGGRTGGSAAATAPASQGASPTSTAHDSSSTSEIIVINGSTVVGGSKPTSSAGATSTGGSPTITGSAQWALALGAGAYLLAN